MMIFLPNMGTIVLLGLPGVLIMAACAACKHAYDAYQNKKAHQRLDQWFQRREEFMEQDPGYLAARDELKRIENEIERMRKTMDPHDELYALYRARNKAKDIYDVKRDILTRKFCENQKTS